MRKFLRRLFKVLCWCIRIVVITFLVLIVLKMSGLSRWLLKLLDLIPALPIQVPFGISRDIDFGRNTNENEVDVKDRDNNGRNGNLEQADLDKQNKKQLNADEPMKTEREKNPKHSMLDEEDNCFIPTIAITMSVATSTPIVTPALTLTPTSQVAEVTITPTATPTKPVATSTPIVTPALTSTPTSKVAETTMAPTATPTKPVATSTPRVTPALTSTPTSKVAEATIVPTATPTKPVVTATPQATTEKITTQHKMLRVCLTEELLDTVLQNGNAVIGNGESQITLNTENSSLLVTTKANDEFIRIETSIDVLSKLRSNRIFSICVPYRKIEINSIYAQMGETNTDIATFNWFFEEGEYKYKVTIESSKWEWLMNLMNKEKRCITIE